MKELTSDILLHSWKNNDQFGRRVQHHATVHSRTMTITMDDAICNTTLFQVVNHQGQQPTIHVEPGMEDFSKAEPN